MKLIIFLAILLTLVVGCSTVQNSPSGQTIKTNQSISEIQDLTLNTQDLQQLGITNDFNEQDLAQLGITNNGTNCQIEENYANIVDSSLGQHIVCIYNISDLNNTKVIIELSKFANLNDLNGTYQYDSLHLYSIQGLISENDYGDQSRFRVNNVNDYGGQFNNPNIYTYHLWICKDKYLIHITSSGSLNAKESIAKIGQQILSKFK